MKSITQLQKIAQLIRYWILLSTTQAGSGHPTSSLSAVELTAALFFGGKFRFDLDNPKLPNNDRIIFSKGHASPLLYALFAAAGRLSEAQLKTVRKFESPLEGHPVPRFPYAEAATGSLGQGLSVGVGMALNAKYLDKLPYVTYVLLGDSEMAEGSCWEAIQSAAFYKLDNLVGIIDVNRLGQRGETMYGHRVSEYKKRIKAFGWQTVVVKNGHNIKEVLGAYEVIGKAKDRPTMIIAKTIKGKGVSFLEDKNGWHGKALSGEEFERAKKELGKIDFAVRRKIMKPKKENPTLRTIVPQKDLAVFPVYKIGDKFATRKAYGIALAKLGSKNPAIVSLDAEVKNSTFAEIFESYFPDRFFEMFIAEQNMVGVALGLGVRGKIPFVSTFAAFLSRAFDQIRMSQYSQANIKFIGSHVGVSIGEDGPSQMGLEDIALFRTLLSSVVLYPSDAFSCEKLVQEALSHKGIVYLRTTRKETPIIYNAQDTFPIGKCKVLRESKQDLITLVGAGITLHEILAAAETLKKQGIAVRVIDLYSIKPIDEQTLQRAARETKAIITVEDHFAEGGIGEAVMDALAEQKVSIYSLAVRKMPRSGKPEELLSYEEISRDAIIKKVQLVCKS